ncbi:MAG: Asp-tRNA(Asn)/Glu-tRNA(Gln) amidotransferase subunit GatC [Candidatus Saccharimonadales bacterium]
MADITRDDVLKLARLTRISLSDDEIAEFQNEFAEILKYVEQLNGVDISSEKPTTQVTGLTNVMREDVVKDYGYTAKDLLKNAPDTQGDLLKVKRMIG